MERNEWRDGRIRDGASRGGRAMATMTDEAAIRARIRQIVHDVTNIPIAEIPASASLRDELDLDSLSLMEIGVDVDYEYKLGLPDEALQQIDSVDDAVRLVRSRLAERDERDAASEVA